MNSIQLSFFLINFLFFMIVYIESLSMIGQSKTIPQNYEILLDFGGNNDDCSVKNCIYTGEVNITLKVTGRTDFFSIQADSKMKIDEKKTRLYRIDKNNNSLQQISIIDISITYGDVSSIIEIYLEPMTIIVPVTQYVIELFFSREFEDLRGYYHPIDNISNRIVAIALLIPNRAYRLFPCLSDLKWLSTFELSIIHPTEFSVLSGTPLKYRKKMAPNTSISVYQSTEKIQAHHVFFAIWSYKKYETDTINFWYPSEIEDEDVKMLIVYYIHSFGLMMNNTFSSKSRFNVVSFPGSRVIDFYTTRGVSLLRESRVIFDKDESTTTDRMEMLTDISRSTVRYWIGILHFPRFWDDYWIYTAIADYIATFIFHVIEPTFRIHDFSLARTILWTRCDRDTMAASTIPFYLFDTWEDRKYFRKEEYISYQALTIVATIHQLFDFKDIMGLIRLFLSRWGNESFGPTLKEMLSLLDNKSVESFTNDWLKNRGTPLITITLDELGEYAEIVQERFNTFGPGSTVNYTWTIPIRCINHQTNKFYHLWLKSKSLFVNATEIKFCLLSGHSVVPYRVNYPEAWWIDIIQLLRHNHLAISEMQRMWIIDDLYELSVAGYIHIEYLYHLFEYLKMEFDYFPWLAVGKVFGKLKNMLSLSKYENHKAFHRRLLVGLISNVYNTLKMEPTQSHENYYIRLHRKNIMNLACTYGHEDCLKESEWRLDCYLNAVSHDCPKGRCSMKWKKCASNPDVREIIFCQGLRHATPKFWYKAFQLLNGSTLFHSTRLVISRGLACTENIHILENYLDFMLNDEKIFPGENVFPILLTAARMSEEHAQLILYFITKHHVKLVERIQTAHEYHKHSAQIAEEIYSDESVRKTSKHMPDDEEVSYLLPENVKKVLTANTKIANKIVPLVESYIKKKLQKILN
ncbi:aminopeptidase N-like isoform X2 [Chelonus insularis]|uniref:aminopeptidase N-like isoform X2 n=1 Tax=Chelonus insularis TaxID=460826 RepID=UPI0015897D28|nr:aminopeptidase N-like isoform X2 [Chelonus insularis]